MTHPDGPALAEPFYCSAAARSRAEQVFGTARRIDTWVLIEYAGLWPARGVGGTSLPESFKTWASSLPPSHQLLLIKQAKHPPPYQGFVVRSGEAISSTFGFRFEDYGSIPLTNPIRRPEMLMPMPGVRLLLVCTHGNKDKCCAKFGLQVFRACYDQLGAQVWQCSHLGGDRFAANVLHLPQGVLYGHVGVGDVEQLADALRNDRIRLQNYRGRTCYSQMEQVGEYFVRQQSTVFELIRLRLVGSSNEGSDWIVSFADHEVTHTVRFRVDGHAFSERLTCGADASRPITQYSLQSYSIG